MSETPAESRAAKVLRLRQEIAAGTYDTPERLSAAVEKFVDRTIRNTVPIAPPPHHRPFSQS